MPNLETIKEEFRIWILGEARGGEMWLLPTIESISDWWLNKIKERDAMLWQKLEDMKRNPQPFTHIMFEEDIGYNQALSDAQALLEVKEK